MTATPVTDLTAPPDADPIDAAPPNPVTPGPATPDAAMLDRSLRPIAGSARRSNRSSWARSSSEKPAVASRLTAVASAVRVSRSVASRSAM